MAGHAATVGLSGDPVHVVVHKLLGSDTPEGRRKFWGEMGKQMTLARLPGVLAPPVIDATANEYVRPWVPGENLETHIAVHPEEAEQRADELLEICRVLRKVPAPGDCEPLPSYVGRLVLHARDTVEERRDAEYAQLVGAMAKSEIWACPGFSHGDLNLQNVIVDPDGRLWLIDPLLNPCETPWWDIGKLLQSTYVNWAALRAGQVEPPAPHLRAMAERFLQEDRGLGLFFLFLVLLRILRHAPSQAMKAAVLHEALRVGWDHVDAVS